MARRTPTCREADCGRDPANMNAEAYQRAPKTMP
jgi:hypothetical protein